MLFRRNSIWWYDFSFRNQRVRESTHSRSKTVAREAEQQRRRDLERGIHNITEVQQNRIRALADIAADYLADYRLRYRGVTFAEYAVGHVVRLLGDKLVVDIDDAAVIPSPRQPWAWSYAYLRAARLAHADSLIASAEASQGQTDLFVVPEIRALFHEELASEPTSYPRL